MAPLMCRLRMLGTVPAASSSDGGFDVKGGTMRRFVPVALLVAVLSAFAGPLAALPAAAAPTPAAPGGAVQPATPSAPYKPAVPYPRAGVCVDRTGTLTASTCAKVVGVLGADERATTDEIALAIVPTTGGDPIETWATGLFNAWGVGKAGKDNGVLLVIALEDHRLRIATGDGARTRLTDYGAQVIIDSTITPLLRAGRTEDAVLAGLDEIRRSLGHSITSANALTTVTDDDIRALTPSGPDSGSGGGSNAIWLLFGLLVIVPIGSRIFSSYMKSAHGAEYEGLADSEKPWWARSRGYGSRYGYSSWDSGSSSSSSSSSHSSGSSGSGGGHSSGGGASGSW
jgi:uncharacterized protein